eukprot:gene3138-3342_t
MLCSLVRLFEENKLRLFDYLTQDEILTVVSANHGFRDEYFLSVCQVRVDRRKLLELFRKGDRWKDLLNRMKDPSKQLIVNESKKVMQAINKDLIIASKSEFLKGLKAFPAYSIIPERLRFPSLHSLTIEYEFYLYICELSEKNHYQFTIQSLDLFTFASSCDKVRKAVASWVKPYLRLATRKLSIKDWPLNKEMSCRNMNRQFFPKLSSSLEVLSFRYCGSLTLHKKSLPNLQRLLLRDTSIKNLKDLTDLAVLELRHQRSVNGKNIPLVKKLILEKCDYLCHLKALQGIEEVEINNCHISDYRSLFTDVKRLSIDIMVNNDDEYSDSEEEDSVDGSDQEDGLDERRFSHNNESKEEDEDEESNEIEHDRRCVEDELEHYHDDEDEEEVDEYEDAYGPLIFNLSLYFQLESAKFILRDRAVEGPLISQDLPKSLRSLILSSSYPNALELSYFSNLDTVVIGDCNHITSVLGLGNVRRLTLDNLGALTSLTGLGGNHNGSNSEKCGNQFVKIHFCDGITDFSPLNHVKVVHINYCNGFTNGFDVDHVHSLTITSCHSIVDISMLHQVQSLKFITCDHILSLEGLENVPNMSVERCRHLQLRHHKEPVFKKDYGVRVILDSLTILADSLYPEILKYLENEDQLSMIHCNCYLYQRLIRKYRTFHLLYHRTVQSFFKDSLFREKVLDRIEDTSKQLKLKNPPILVDFTDPMIFCVGGWYELTSSVSSFCPLLETFPNAFPSISSLYLSNIYQLQADINNEKAISALNGTLAVKDQLTLRNIFISSSIKLPETMNHLILDHCVLSIENLHSILQNLRSLTIRNHTKLLNMGFLNNLHILKLENMKQLINLFLFRKVKQLYVSNCRRLQNIDLLQENEKIVFDFSIKTVIEEQHRHRRNEFGSDDEGDEDNVEEGDDGGDEDENQSFFKMTGPKVYNLLHHFFDSKNIEISIIDDSIFNKINFVIDLSDYYQVQRFTLKGKFIRLHKLYEDVPFPSFYSKNIPTSLKVLKLHGIMNLKTLGEGNFDHLQSVEIVRSGLTSLVGLGNVPIVRLEDLDDLKSLAGLGNRNQKIVLKRIKLMDFAAVRNVYDLTFIGCPYITSMPMVYGAKRLRFECCSGLESLHCNKDLEKLEVYKCNKLKRIYGMDKSSEVDNKGLCLFG